MKIRYITKDEALHIHDSTIALSGGGDYGQINVGYLLSALDHIQNDDYYPTFEEKLVHLIWSVNKNHSFSDGNKRLSITLGLQFLNQNGYLYCIPRFLTEMENISYHLAKGHDIISKELLTDLIHSILEGETDFSEELKLRYLIACSQLENLEGDESDI
jgi:death-on-curing protein